MRILTLILAVISLSILVAPAQADLLRAQNLFEQGRAQEALTEVEQLLRNDPTDAETRFLQGIIYADMGRSDSAIEVFAGLAQDYPELPEPYNNLAVLFAEKGEFEKARDALLAAIQTHPSYSTAHENLGDLYAKMAGIAYDRALEEDGLNESARLKLSAVNGLFSAPASVTQVAQNTQSTPAPIVVESQPEPDIIQSEPIPETIPAVAQTRPEPVVTQPEPEPEPVQVAVATPDPDPVTPASTSDDDVRAAVMAWASAWSNQNVDGYLAVYAPDFRPANGAPRSSWVRYRRERLTAPSSVQVDVGDIDVELISSDRARATFVQGYRSDNYRDQVVKTLNMRLTGQGWQITSEGSEAI